MSQELPIFLSQEGKDLYLAAYEAMFDLWPVQHQSCDVPTRAGLTYINISGPEDGPPLFLLAAAGNSSTTWFANVGPLSRYYRVYAVDIIGDAGRSRPFRKLQSVAEHGDWLAELIEGLGIERAHVAGHSQGGWMALALALTHPERLGKLVLLAPAASLQPFGWFTKLALALAGRMLRPDARGTLKFAAAKGAQFEERYVHQMNMVNEYCLPVTMMPTVYTDQELSQISAPTLLLIGDQEKIYNPHRAIKRVERFMPHAETALIPNAGHLLIMEQPDTVNERILAFLAPALGMRQPMDNLVPADGKNSELIVVG